MKSLSTLFFGLAVITLVGMTGQANAAVIADFLFAGGSAVSTDAEPNSTADDFTKNPSTADWGFSSTSSNVFARSNATTDSEAAAIAAGDYFRFKVTPSVGFEMDLTQLKFDTIHNATFGGGGQDTNATMNFSVRSSLDGFGANIGSTYSQAWNSTTSQTVDLSAPAFQDVSGETEFRFYIHDSGVDTQINGARMDNIHLVGAVAIPGSTSLSFQEGVSPAAAYTADAVYIRQSEPTINQNADPDREMIVGFTDDNTELRGLLEFDVSAIPASSTIDSISLVLQTGGGLSTDITINAYEYGFDFDETTATWNAPGTADTTAGGTLGTLLTSATFNPTLSGSVAFSDSDLFRTALSDALADDGFLRLILARSDSSGVNQQRFARFNDETFSTLGYRPELLVAYNDTAAVPEPSTLVLAVLGMLGLGWFQRRRGQRA